MDKIKEFIGSLRELWWTYRRVLIFLSLLLFSIYGAWKVFGRLFILAICIYVAYYAIKHRGALANTRLQDWINPLKWGSVLFASFTKMLYPMHIVEQLIIRMYDKECRKCMENGSCFHCGCDMSKVYTPWDVCSKGNWGRTIENAKEYKEMRKEFPVIIDIRYPMEEKNWSNKGFDHFLNTGKALEEDQPAPA